MNLPGIVLGLVMSSLYGAGFHIWRGGGLRRLLLFLVLAWIGFWTGQIAGVQFDLAIGKVGTLLLGPATAGSLAFLFLGNWLFNQPG